LNQEQQPTVPSEPVREDPRASALLPQTEELQAWQSMLHGIALMYWAMLAPLVAALACGLFCTAVIDFRSQHVHGGWMIGLFGMGFVYVLGLVGILVGLHCCARVPSSFKGRFYVQAAFVFTLACGMTLALHYALQAFRVPWRSHIDPGLGWLLTGMMRWIPIASVGLALVSWMLFVRAVAGYFGQRGLAAQVARQLRGFSIWVAGVVLLLPLADFLSVEAPWLQALAGAWMLVGGGMLVLDVVRVTEALRRTVRDIVHRASLAATQGGTPC
jgi:hypothetical protein